jgi:hypothetical protein
MNNLVIVSGVALILANAWACSRLSLKENLQTFVAVIGWVAWLWLFFLGNLPTTASVECKGKWVVHHSYHCEDGGTYCYENDPLRGEYLLCEGDSTYYDRLKVEQESLDLVMKCLYFYLISGLSLGISLSKSKGESR